MYDLVTGGVVGQQWDCALLVWFMSVKDCRVHGSVSLSSVGCVLGRLVGWFGLVVVGWWVGGWVALHQSMSMQGRFAHG
jgi:hypothetical protein